MKVGITGHQDLGDAVAWTRATVNDLVRTLPATHGYTSLAAGADQLFADILVERGIPFTAVVPSQGYEHAFASVAAREHYLKLVEEAAERTTLAFDRPSEEAFLAAGQHVVRSAAVLIAVWNGQGAKGRGGTADIVAFALGRGTPVWHCNPMERTVTQIGG